MEAVKDILGAAIGHRQEGSNLRPASTTGLHAPTTSHPTDAELERIRAAVREGRSGRAFDVLNIPPRYRGKRLRKTPMALDALAALREGRSLFLTGACGSGKTELAVTLLQEWLADGLTRDERGQIISAQGKAQFVSVPDLLLRIKASWDKDEGARGQNESGIIEQYSRLAFFVLDDLGAEKVSEWTRSVFYTLIDRRYRDNRQTIITSNKSLKLLAEEVDDRIVSRISETCVAIDMGRKDWRVG